MQESILSELQPFCSVSSTATQAENEEAWLAARSKGVGGSEVGAICGVNQWSSALQIYFNKTGQFQEDTEPSDAAKERMHWGHMLEPVVADEFERRNPGLTCYETNCSFKSNEYPFLLANIDRLVLDSTGKIQGILECKTAGAQMVTEWENGEIPESYYYQVQHYMFITGIHRGWICCLAGGNKFFQYDIFFDNDLYTKVILPQLDDFWNNHVLKLQEPEVQSSDNELFNELFPADDLSTEPVNFSTDFEAIGKEYLEIKKRQKEDKKRLEELQAIIKQQLMTHTKGFSPSYSFVWSPRTRTSVDSTYLKVHYPDIYNECCITTSYRQMSVSEVIDEDLGF